MQSNILSQDMPAIKSKSPGAIGTAYIESLADSQSDITGLVPSSTTIIKKEVSASISLTNSFNLMENLRVKALNPINHGNLSNPELLSSWSVTNGGSISLVDDELPAPFNSEMKSYIGNNVKVVKITPDGINQPFASLNLPSAPAFVDSSRNICFEYFIYTPSGAVNSRLEFHNASYLYNHTFSNLPVNEWQHIVCRDLKSPNGNLYKVAFMNLSKTSPTYIVGVMICYDFLGGYSPFNHSYSQSDFEIGGQGNGLILTDSVTSQRHKLTLVDSALLGDGIELKTKIYSPNGVPYKIVVADDGTVSSVLDAIFYDSFDRADSATSLGSTWVAASGTWGVLNNEAYCVTNTGTRRVNIDAGATNFSITCQVKGSYQIQTFIQGQVLTANL